MLKQTLAPISIQQFFFNLTVTDNCDPNPSLDSNFRSGYIFPVGNTQVTAIGTDAGNNIGTCMFYVIVTQPADSESPVVRVNGNPCGPPIYAQTALCTDLSIEVFFYLTVTDNCDPNPSLDSNINSGDIFPVGDSRTNTIARDNGGNIGTCNFEVVVTQPEDLWPPVVMVDGNICGEPIFVQTTFCTDNSTAVFFDLTVTDNCDSTPTLNSNFNSGYLFPVGGTLVRAEATDDNGNVGICVFDIFVTQLLCGV